jgi:hypothetical protein
MIWATSPSSFVARPFVPSSRVWSHPGPDPPTGWQPTRNTSRGRSQPSRELLARTDLSSGDFLVLRAVLRVWRRSMSKPDGVAKLSPVPSPCIRLPSHRLHPPVIVDWSACCPFSTESWPALYCQAILRDARLCSQGCFPHATKAQDGTDGLDFLNTALPYRRKSIRHVIALTELLARVCIIQDILYFCLMRL